MVGRGGVIIIISSVNGVVSRRRPVSSLASPDFTSPSSQDGVPEWEKADEEVGNLCDRRGRRLALQVSCFQQSQSGPSSFAPPPPQDIERRRRESTVRKNKKSEPVPLPTTVNVWLDCFGQSLGRDWSCNYQGGRHWHDYPWPHSPDLQSFLASPGWEGAWSQESPSSGWWPVQLL